MTYLDHNATTPVRAEVVQVVGRVMAEVEGNPSSVHAAGRRARDVVERARRQVAAAFGADTEEVVFTSGGTEADQLGILGLAALAEARGRRHVVASSLEHPAVMGALEALAALGFAVSWLPVTAAGEIADGALEAA